MALSQSAELVGRVLGGRYRLLRPLGTGASAHVYVAEDVTLRRRVAIKVLHSSLTSDLAFLRRFRAEAQVVAALRHPNILRVYDWGEDEGSPYLVMELLEGGSLRAMLDRGQLLSPAQAAAVGADAARALDHAHRRGLVHRDVKPANLIFDEEGRLTVADFGLARALAEATWTEPTGAVVGTARYAAPEMARGELLEGKADVYALALVLVEATTGAVPFSADTTLGTLMARVERPLSAPAQLGPLAEVVEAAGTVDPAERISAAELATALDGVAARLPPPSPLPLAGLPDGALPGEDPDPTQIPGKPAPFDAEAEGAPEAPAGREVPPASQPALVAQAALATEPAPLSGAQAAPKRRWLRRLALLLAALVVAAAAAGAGLYEEGFFIPSHPVPSVVGDTLARAKEALSRLHLHLAISSRSYEARVGAGRIVSQQPLRGSLKEGQAVSVVVSLGPEPVPVPKLANLQQSAAVSALEALGLRAGPVTTKASMTVPAGVVMSSNPPAGTPLVPGRSVALVVSSGKPKVAVPALSGPSAQSYAAAQAALSAVGLLASQEDVYSDTVPQGQVVGTYPSAGFMATVGATVVVEVSKGPRLIAVPNVAGDSVSQASQTLSNDGFQVSGVSGNPTANVTGTSPPAGTALRPGSAVQILT